MDIGIQTRIVQKTPFSFDAAQWEILAVAVGATVIMAGTGDYRDPEKLVALCFKFDATTLQAVPTLWAALAETEGFARLPLCQMFSGGEVLTTQLARDLRAALPSAQLINLYGPTETTINATSHVVTAADLSEDHWAVPIGDAVAEMDLLILDENGESVRAGESGEVVIVGIQVARGYVGRPEESARVFGARVGLDGHSRRTYRTGDLASRDEVGAVTFVGRQDNQHKINGHRVELDEVRLAVENHDWIKRAAIVPWTSKAGAKQLAAFIELDGREAALMDNGTHDHHQSKESRVQVRAQLSDDGIRSASDFDGVQTISLPNKSPTDDQTRDAFARKSYRTFHGGVGVQDIADLISGAVAPIAVEVTDRTEHERLGSILRWFGPFLSTERLLPKYAYASPGALNATQIYLEVAGVPGTPDGVYYFHPVKHLLARVGNTTAPAGVRLHLVGNRSRIEQVYPTNVDEVLHFEAGHKLGVLELVAAKNGWYVQNHPIDRNISIDVLLGEAYLLTACVELVVDKDCVDESVHPDVLVQVHEAFDGTARPGLHRYTSSALDWIGDEVVRRKDVVAINQSVYDRSAFGISLVTRQEGWSGFVALGRLLHRMQWNQCGIGLMSSGYSSLSGSDLPSAARTAAILRTDETAEKITSYFVLGGGISAEQQSSQGMDEDIVHMRGPAEILRDGLRESLPEYMVPTRVALVDRLHTMANGKVDLQRLQREIAEEESFREMIAPRTDVERAISGMWAHLLRTSEELSVRDSFFSVGGNSLTGVSLINQINRTFGLHLPLQALFTSSTIEDLALQVHSGSPNPLTRLVPLSPSDTSQPRVYCWPGLGGYPLSLRTLGQTAAGDAHAFVGVQAQGINRGELPFHTVQEMATADVDLIMASQPDGPCDLPRLFLRRTRGI